MKLSTAAALCAMSFIVIYTRCGVFAQIERQVNQSCYPVPPVDTTECSLDIDFSTEDTAFVIVETSGCRTGSSTTMIEIFNPYDLYSRTESFECGKSKIISPYAWIYYGSSTPVGDVSFRFWEYKKPKEACQIDKASTSDTGKNMIYARSKSCHYDGKLLIQDLRRLEKTIRTGEDQGESSNQQLLCNSKPGVIVQEILTSNEYVNECVWNTDCLGLRLKDLEDFKLEKLLMATYIFTDSTVAYGFNGTTA